MGQPIDPEIEQGKKRENRFVALIPGTILVVGLLSFYVLESVSTPHVRDRMKCFH